MADRHGYRAAWAGNQGPRAGGGDHFADLVVTDVVAGDRRQTFPHLLPLGLGTATHSVGHDHEVLVALENPLVILVHGRNRKETQQVRRYPPGIAGTGHILGTDTLGRDVLSMLLAATTPTFVIGLTAALSTAIVGTALSVTAAYFRGKVDILITNLADVFLLFPAPIIMVIIGARFRDLGPVPLGLIYGIVTGAGAVARPASRGPR